MASLPYCPNASLSRMPDLPPAKWLQMGQVIHDSAKRLERPGLRISSSTPQNLCWSPDRVKRSAPCRKKQTWRARCPLKLKSMRSEQAPLWPSVPSRDCFWIWKSHGLPMSGGLHSQNSLMNGRRTPFPSFSQVDTPRPGSRFSKFNRTPSRLARPTDKGSRLFPQSTYQVAPTMHSTAKCRSTSLARGFDPSPTSEPNCTGGTLAHSKNQRAGAIRHNELLKIWVKSSCTAANLQSASPPSLNPQCFSTAHSLYSPSSPTPRTARITTTKQSPEQRKSTFPHRQRQDATASARFSSR